MAKSETKSSAQQDPDYRYKYIGFDVFGGRVREFFKTEEEKKKHVEIVRQYSATHAATLRSGTAVNANLLPLVDKVVLTIASLALIVGSVLPWFSVSTIYGSIKIPGVTAFSAVSAFTDLIARFSPMLPNLVYVLSALAAVSFILGVLTLVMLYLPSKNRDKSLSRLKSVMRLQYVPIIVWVATFIYLIVGIDIPFGKDLSDIYMIKGLGSQFNIVTFWVFAQPALWVTFGGLVVNSVKSNEL
jgi:hypothetical protein